MAVSTRLDATARRTRDALRSLRRTPAVTVFIVATLAFGLGANAGFVTLATVVLFEDLPVSKPSDLYFINVHGVRDDRGGSSYSLFRRLKSGTTHFSDLAAFQPADLRVTIDDHFESVSGEYASGNLFQVLGLGAALGRGLLPSDDTIVGQGGVAGPVAVISHDFWQRRFGGDAGAIGKRIRVGTVAATIVGVTPLGFTGLQPGRRLDVTLPLTLFHPRVLQNNRAAFLNVIGRLRPHATRELARAELQSTLMAWLRDEAVSTTAQRDYMSTVRLSTARGGLDSLRREFSGPILALAGMVFSILVLTCASVAALLLGRVAGRQHELSTRLALGASRSELVAQLGIETLLLVAAGTSVGLFLGWSGARTLVGALATADNRLFLELRPDLQITSLIVAVAAVTTVLCGIAPAFWAARIEPGEVLRKDARAIIGTRGRIAQALVACQIAAALVLVTAAGLLTQTLQHLVKVDKGFDAVNVLTMRVEANPVTFSETQIKELWATVLNGVAETPGITASALSNLTPLARGNAGAVIRVPGYVPSSESDLQVTRNDVSQGYFATMRIPILGGRPFSERDGPTSQPVAILAETAARFYFGGIPQAIGRSIAFGQAAGAPGVEIIGVVHDTVHRSLREPVPRLVYLPLPQALEDHFALTLSARAAGDPLAVQNVVRERINGISGQILVKEVRPLSIQVRDSLRDEYLLAILSAVFGLAALILAAMGLYGIVWQAVIVRTGEIGLRIAMGATPGAVVAVVVKGLLPVLGTGIVLGMSGSLLAGQVLKSQLFGVQGVEPMTTVSTVMIFGITAAVACAVPLRRAVHTDPAATLRAV